MGSQVLAADVRVRVVMDAVANVGAQEAATGRLVQGRRGVPVVNDEQHSSFKAGSGGHDPAIRWRDRPRRAGRGRAERPPPRGGHGARRWRPGRPASRTPRRRRVRRRARRSRRAPRPITRWTGSASRTSLARIAPTIGPPSSGSSTWPAPAAARRSLTWRMRSGARSATRYLRTVRSGEPARASPSTIPVARAPDPAPCSRTVNRPGRPRRSQTSSSWRAIVQPKIGWDSGEVRKSAPRPGPRRPVA